VVNRVFTQGGYSRQWLAIEQLTNREGILGNMLAPTLVITGMEDPSINPSHGHSAHRFIRNSELLMVPNVGHWLNQGICQVVLTWLEQKFSD